MNQPKLSAKPVGWLNSSEDVPAVIIAVNGRMVACALPFDALSLDDERFVAIYVKPLLDALREKLEAV